MAARRSRSGGSMSSTTQHKHPSSRQIKWSRYHFLGRAPVDPRCYFFFSFTGCSALYTSLPAGPSALVLRSPRFAQSRPSCPACHFPQPFTAVTYASIVNLRHQCWRMNTLIKYKTTGRDQKKKKKKKGPVQLLIKPALSDVSCGGNLWLQHKEAAAAVDSTNNVFMHFHVGVLFVCLITFNGRPSKRK